MTHLTREQLLMIAIKLSYEVKALKKQVKILSKIDNPFIECEGDGNLMYQPGEHDV